MANKDWYSVLKISSDASESQIESAYVALKAKYSEDRFLSGEAGNEGAKNLMELEVAYKELKAAFTREATQNTYGNDLGDVDNMIKTGKINEAQERLDASSNRTAEWHYLQSIVFYKRDWMSESKKQLQMAIQLEPNNSKYRTALEKLEMVIGNPTVNAENLGRQQASSSGTNGQPNATNTLSNCCMAYICTSCCCDCMTMC